MTEKRFLSFVLVEGILLSALGLAMLMLPKITTISFGLMLCLTFIIYGGYKVINAILTRNYSRHFVLNIVAGTLLFLTGVFLFMAPMFNLILITSAIGVYYTRKYSFNCICSTKQKYFIFLVARNLGWHNAILARFNNSPWFAINRFVGGRYTCRHKFLNRRSGIY